MVSPVRVKKVVLGWERLKVLFIFASSFNSL